jgi:hypothetical protein
MELETLNKLYLELSQIVTAQTPAEIALEQKVKRLEKELANEKKNYHQLAAHHNKYCTCLEIY